MVEELDVTKMVMCPDQEMMVDAGDCAFCAYYHGMGDLEFTLICGFTDKEKNADHSDDEDEK